MLERAALPDAPEQKRSYLTPSEVILGAAPPAEKGATSEKSLTPTTTRFLRVGYDTRHLLPSFVAGVVWTMLAVMGLVWLNGRMPIVVAPVVSSLITASIAAVWAFLLFRWAYRGLCWRLEVNEQEIVYRRGWLWPKWSSSLAELARVEVQQNWVQRLLGFGHLALIPEQPGAPATVILGLAEPHILAEQITHRIQQARHAHVRQQRLTLSETDPVQSEIG